MKKYFELEILSNYKMTTDIYDMTLKTFEIANMALSGQFVELFVENNKNILPRPISICEVDKQKGTIRLVYQVVGEGTEKFATLQRGNKIKIMGSLGNGFTIKNSNNVAVMGGGIGVPPMLELTKNIAIENENANISVYLGFRDEKILEEDFKKYKPKNGSINVYIATDSGKSGYKGNVLSLLKEKGETYDIIYACGPKPMLKAISNYAKENNISCQVSMEQRMACGLGACVGCVIKIKEDDRIVFKKVCKDGPVFDGKEVAWDE